ncbi:MAG: cobalamin biosynthesis protein [Chromatiales bacterium]
MWGYRNGRYLDFGWAAARLDDALNYVPARLTALTYAVLGNSRQALRCWRTRARGWASPNAGPVMAAGAGALGVIIGGPARYADEWHVRLVLGVGQPPAVDDIEGALGLVRGGVWLWLTLFGLAGALHA